MQHSPISNYHAPMDEYDGAETLDAGETFCICLNKYAYHLSKEDAKWLLEDLQNFFLGNCNSRIKLIDAEDSD